MQCLSVAGYCSVPKQARDRFLALAAQTRVCECAVCAGQELSGQTKVCLRVDDEEGLMQLHQDARNAGGSFLHRA